MVAVGKELPPGAVAFSRLQLQPKWPGQEGSQVINISPHFLPCFLISRWYFPLAEPNSKPEGKAPVDVVPAGQPLQGQSWVQRGREWSWTHKGRDQGRFLSPHPFLVSGHWDVGSSLWLVQ